MPRGHQARVADELELMDMDEATVAAAELEAAAEEEAEQKEMITVNAADYQTM